VKEIKEGKRQFTPDREKDLLTLVLGNDEHGGRTRGFGPYQLLARLNDQQQQINELRGVVRQQDPALDITAGPSKRKSSVAESEAPTDDAR
jgi:hypothetical protein